MRNRYLSACWDAFGKANKRVFNETDRIVAKAVFELIKSGKYKEAAKVAETNDFAKSIWEKTLE